MKDFFEAKPKAKRGEVVNLSHWRVTSPMCGANRKVVHDDAELRVGEILCACALDGT